MAFCFIITWFKSRPFAEKIDIYSIYNLIYLNCGLTQNKYIPEIHNICCLFYVLYSKLTQLTAYKIYNNQITYDYFYTISTVIHLSNLFYN